MNIEVMYRVRVIDIDEECVGESNTNKGKESGRGKKKRLKLESGEEPGGR